MKDFFSRFSRAKIHKKKYAPHTAFATFAVFFVLGSIFSFNSSFVYAATYNFTQSSWAGGTDEGTGAVHASNQSNWTKYSSQSGLTVGTDIQIPTSTVAFTDDGATSTSPVATAYGGDFDSGTNSSTAVSGSGTSASVGLSLGDSVAVNSWDTALKGIPGGVSDGSSMIRNASDDSIYVIQGNATTGFYRYSISGNIWTTLTAAPGAISYGSNMIRNGSDDYIYVTRGGNTTSFYRYSISGNSWTTLATVPGAITYGGSRMIRDGASDDIYVTRGGNFTAFYKYSISGNSWTTLTAAPGAIYYESSMIRNGSDDDIYVTRGGGLTSFYRYSISGNSWTTLTVVPGAISYGSSMTRNASEDYIYVTAGGNSTAFYRYSISGNSWTTLTVVPEAIYSGSKIIRNASDDFIYVTAGSGTAFYRYSISGNSWTTLTVAPGTIGSGSVMIRNGSDNEIYVTQGDSSGTANITGFFRYSISGNSWTSSNVSNLTAAPGGINAYSNMIRNGAEDYVYVTRGDATTAFYRYSISGNSWTTLTVAPGTLGAGSKMIRNASDDYIYVTRGNTSTAFYRYSISGNSWTTLTAAPGTISNGSTMIRNGSDDAIYVTQGGTTDLYRYSVSGNSWTTLTAAPDTIANGSTMIRNSSDDAIYVTRGVNTTGFYRYSISGNSWTTLTAAPATISNGSTMIRNGSDNDIYVTQGNSSNGFYRYSISGNSWTTLAVIPGTINVGSFMIRNSSDNEIYVTRGNTTTGFYRYSISGDSWTTLIPLPGTIANGSTMIRNSSDNEIYVTQGNSATGFYKFIINQAPYNASGTFTSAVIDVGAASSFTTLAYTTTLNSQTITLDVRAGNTATPDGTWTGWTTGVASGGSISALAGNRYIQYRANLSTSNTTVTPTLDSVTISYDQYGSGDLTSSIYDSGDAANLVTNMTWTASATSGTEIVKFQVRSAATSEGIAAASWCGTSTTCDGTSYFTDSAGGTVLASDHPLRSGGNDRYFQYKVFLSSGGAATPVLTQTVVQYVVNAAPSFDATYGTNGTIVSQSTAASSDAGAVTISYSVRDTDTDTGSANPGQITPSFEYNTGAGWVAIDSGALASGNTGLKTVDGSIYTTYSATWFATSTLADTYDASVQVRVTANDNEAANNTATAASATFALDTKAPVVTAIVDGSSNGSITLTATDDSELRYRTCNDAAFPSADTEGNSCAWSSLGGNLASTSIAWTPRTDAQGNQPVYLQVADAFGNATAQTLVAPAALSSFDLKDISNPDIDVYKEFLSWSVFTATTSSTFSSYKLYSSTDGISYSLLSTIEDSATNYYIHTITTATSSTRYYKATVTTTQGNISAYTSVLSDVPNGQGGTDITYPVISSASIVVPGATLRNSSALVTFTTDELARGSIQYRETGTEPWTTVNSSSYVLAHSIYAQGLSANTTYNVQVKATDVSGNVSAYVAGENFTTPGGPVITNVTHINLDDDSVSIVWNTATSSDSYVYYATNSSLTGATLQGSASLVSCISGVCPHQVNIESLTAGTTYYFYVQSTDGLGNTSTDANAGANYSFHTSLDVAPAVISSIATPVISANAAVITWITDKLATSQVLWGSTSGSLNRTTVANATPTIHHVVSLSAETNDTDNNSQELLAETEYFYKVVSVGANGVSTTSAQQTFTSAETGDVIVLSSGGGGGGGSKTLTSTDPANPKTPPVITNLSADNPTAFTANVKIETDKDVVAFVSYGDSTQYGSTEGDQTLSKTKIVTLKRLNEGTTYHYRVTIIDQYGNTTVAPDNTFKTGYVSELLDDRSLLEKASDVQGKLQELIESALPSLAPPFATTPVVSSTTENAATISWTTNIRTNGAVRYASDAEYLVSNSEYTTEVSSSPNTVTTHAVNLTGLLPSTLYHVQARSYVFPQVVRRSEDITFSTKAAPLTANIAEVRNDGFTVAWQTDEPTSSIVEYINQKTGAVNRTADTELKTYHSVKLENLPSGTSYRIEVSGLNKNGNRIEADKSLTVTTTVDVTPPVISSFKVDNALVPGRVGFIQTVVGWQTDKLANSVVFYEEGAGSSGSTKELANKIEALDAFTTSHVIILPNLRAGTVYRLKVVSTDQSGNVKVFGPTSIITPMQTQSVLDIIVKNFEDTFKFLGAKQ